MHILPSYAWMLLAGQNFHSAVLILLLAQLVQRGEASLIPASLLAGLASFDFPVYRCQEFSFEFSPSCLSMLFISNKKILLLLRSHLPFFHSPSFLTVLDLF